MNRSRLVARNVLATLATQLILWGLTFVVTLYLPGYVGDQGLGAITLAASFAAIFSLLVGLGTSTVLIRDVAREPARTGELVLAALLMRLPLGLLAVLLGWGASVLLKYDGSVRLLIVIALGVMVLGLLNDVVGSALRGLQEIPRQSAASIADKFLLAVLTILLVVHKAPLWTFVAVGAVGAVVSLAINTSALIPHLRGVRWPRWAMLRTLALTGMPFLTTAVFVAIYGQSDALLLSKMSSVAAIGWYGLAKRIGGTTLFIPVALTSAMLPALSNMYRDDRPAFDGAVRRLFNLIFICVVPFAAVLIMAPAKILALLHYPPSFVHSIPVLIIMGWAVILWYLSQVAATALIASDRQGALSRITGVSALISFPLCAAFIYVGERYMHNGAVGAMLSDVVIEGYMVVAYLRALPAGLFTWGSFSVLGRAAAAALPLVGLFYAVHDRHSLLLLIPGLLLYIPLCWLLRCLHPQDMQMVQQIMRKRANA